MSQRRPDPVEAPSIQWDEFARRLRWRQGEHVSLIGPTGTGKTHLGLALLPRRRWVTVLAAKPKDATLNRLRRDGYRVMRKWEPTSMERRIILWPKWEDPTHNRAQAVAFHEALVDMFRRGSYTVFADELSWLCEQLNMTRHLKAWWQQGRSVNLTLVGATQRPAWVPLDMYSAATHLFLWRTNDDQDLRRISGLNGADAKVVRRIVAQLDHDRHEFLYANTRTGELVRSHHSP